jgi:GrpB-like predicted nucleotidyltransferase (UPF0157 family)
MQEGGQAQVDEPIRVVPYDPRWPERFEVERVLLDRVIGSWAKGGIHHVGSTAVPGLDAKPTIDILVGIEDLESGRGCFEPLAGCGYLYASYRPEEMHWFCKPDPGRREFHLHLVPLEAARFRNELAFRDRLRLDSALACEYAELKKLLATRFRTDREGYTDGKSDFVARVLGPTGKEAADGELEPEHGGGGAASAADPRLG